MLARAKMRAGCRPREAARLAGLDPSYLLKLETGQRVPSQTVAGILADVLQLDDAEREHMLAAAVGDAGRDHPARRSA